MSNRKKGEPCVRGVGMLCKYCNQKKVCPDSEYEIPFANKKVDAVMNRKIIGIKLVNTVEIAPINESDFNDNDVVNELMNKVRDDIFALGHYCGCSEAIPIFEKEEA